LRGCRDSIGSLKLHLFPPLSMVNCASYYLRRPFFSTLRRTSHEGFIDPFLFLSGLLTHKPGPEPVPFHVPPTIAPVCVPPALQKPPPTETPCPLFFFLRVTECCFHALSRLNSFSVVHHLQLRPILSGCQRLRTLRSSPKRFTGVLSLFRLYPL